MTEPSSRPASPNDTSKQVCLRYLLAEKLARLILARRLKINDHQCCCHDLASTE
jgi:hypothetical protein